MKALILNSGLGHRMGVLTSEHPKCMTEISPVDTILSRQLKIIASYGITEVVMTTGYFNEILVNYCHSLNLPLHYTFINNPLYNSTNYIYSIYCAKEYLRDEDIVFMHGDLVFENSVFETVLNSQKSCMTVSSTIPLPEKDFKAVIHDGKIEKVGIEFFNDALSAQPLYKLNKEDWNVWLDEICKFCESDTRKCYAENAFNVVSDKCLIYPVDVKNKLCAEIEEKQLSVRQLEDKIAKLSEPKKKAQEEAQDLPDEYFRVLEIVGKYFENNISLKRSAAGKGTMTIHFNSDGEVQKFLKALEDSNF